MREKRECKGDVGYGDAPHVEILLKSGEVSGWRIRDPRFLREPVGLGRGGAADHGRPPRRPRLLLGRLSPDLVPAQCGRTVQDVSNGLARQSGRLAD